MPARRRLNSSFLPARAVCQGASVAGQPLPRSKLCPLCLPGETSLPRCRVRTRRGFVGRPHSHPLPRRGGTLAHACTLPMPGAELAATHRQPHSSALSATYIGASRLLSLSEQRGSAYFLEAFQAASLQAALRAPLAPRRGVRMNGCSWSPPASSTMACQHTALGTARGGCKAHAKPRGSGQVCLAPSPQPCSLLDISPRQAEFHKQGPSTRSGDGSFSPWSHWPRGAGGCRPFLCRGLSSGNLSLQVV